MPIYEKFDPNTFQDHFGHLWFDTGKWETITASLDCTFEAYDTAVEVFTGSFGQQLTADLDCEFESFTGLTDQFAARNLSPLTGSLVCLFQVYPVDIEIFGIDAVPITADLDCTFEQWGFFGMTGLHMGLTFEPWVIQAGIFIEGDEMDNCTFREFDLFMTGSSTYVYMDLEFERLEFAASPGAQLVLDFEDPEMMIYGVTGYTGTMDLTMRRFEFSGIAGGATTMDLTFEYMGFDAVADTGIMAGLDLVFRYPTMESAGDSDIVGGLDLRFSRFRLTIDADGLENPRGNMDATFKHFLIGIVGIRGIASDIEANSIKFEIAMTGYSDGPNSLDLVFEEPEMGSQDDGGEGGADCALADTLTFTR